MNYLEKMLLNYLRSSKIKMEITGFDMESFEKVLYHKEKCCLEMIEPIAFMDDDLMMDSDKIETIKQYFLLDFSL